MRRDAGEEEDDSGREEELRDQDGARRFFCVPCQVEEHWS